MPWIESHTEVGRHRKLLLVAEDLGLSLPQVVGHAHLLWHAVLEQQEDGDLSDWPDTMIAKQAQYEGDPKQFVEVLINRHLLEKNRLVHDWLDYAGRYMESKYQSSNYERLKKIWRLHGRVYAKKRKKQMPSGWFKIRRAVLERDGHKCHYCGKTARSVDHVIPRSKGGTDELDNLVSACTNCNFKKQDKTGLQWSFDKRKTGHQKGMVRLSNLGSEQGGVQRGESGFDRFWQAYPRKVGKETAQRAWDKISPGPELTERILAAIAKQRGWPQWVKDGGQFIPYPATWLNRAGWEDELPKPAVEQTAQVHESHREWVPFDKRKEG